jgi:hypothetical protein
MSINIQRLTEILLTNPELTVLAETNDVRGIVSYLNNKDRKRTSNALWTSKGILDKFDLEVGAGIIYGFELASKQDGAFGAILRSAFTTLNTNGLDFSNDKVQGQIEVLINAGVWGENSRVFGELLKGLGIWYESLADQEFGVDVTEQDATDAMALYVRRKLEIKVSERYNEVIDGIISGNLKDWESARAVMGAE